MSIFPELTLIIFLCMEKILVTGSQGMLGSEICPYYIRKGNSVTGIDIEDADITDEDEIISLITREKPDIVIHCAGNTDVDGCEDDRENAYRVNTEGTRHVCTACRNLAVPLVYFSTDYVFDGKKKEPYIEFDKPNPLNVYGKTKLAGEGHAKELNDGYFILRTSWLCGHNGKNFVNTILELSKTRNKISVVKDQIGSPTFTADLIPEMDKIIHSGDSGIYHISNKGECSWFDFARKIVEFAGLPDVEVVPVATKQVNRKAKRPSYSKLRNYVLENTLGDTIVHWEDGLKKYLNV